MTKKPSKSKEVKSTKKLAKPSKIKTQSKYDWAALKAEYMSQSVKEVEAWVKHKLGITKALNGQIKRKIVGWPGEWQFYKDSIARRSLELTKEETAQEMAATLSDARKALRNKAKQIASDYLTRSDDIAQVWKMARIENNLPTSIGKTLLGPILDPELSIDNLENDEGGAEG